MSDNTKLFFINLEVDSKERFDISKFMEFTDNFDPLSSAMFEDIKKLKKGGDFKVIIEEGRPDEVSFKTLGSTQYWWVILLLNGLTQVDDIKIGDRLSFPDLNSLEDLFFSLKSRQSASLQTT